MTPLGKYLASLYPRPELQRSRTICTTTSTARSSRPNRDRHEGAVRLEHQQQHEGVRPDLARSRRRREPARRVVGAVGRGAADAEHRTSNRPLVRRQHRVGAEPVDDERGARQLQPPDARQLLQDPSVCAQGAAASRSTASTGSRSDQSPYLPTNSSTAGAAARSATSWPPPNDVYAHNDALQFSDKLTKLIGAHGLKFGAPSTRRRSSRTSRTRRPASSGSRRSDTGTGTGSPMATCWSAGSTRVLPGHAASRDASRVPQLEHRRVRAGQLEAPAELDARIRRALRQLDQQRGAERPRAATSTRPRTTRARSSFLDPGTYSS